MTETTQQPFICLSRLSETKDGTFGELTLNGNLLCVTVERPWLNNKPKVSCIPAGSYQCAPFNSPKNGDVWLLKDVPDRDMIEIHSANLASELLGCIAPGRRLEMFNGIQGVTYSKLTMATLKQKLPHQFTLTIVNPQP